VRERCTAAGLSFPPSELTLVAFKDTRLLKVIGRSDGAWRTIVAFPILGSSGVSGPKLAEGDRQVPEGLYRIESLNPNSMFHLALRVSYPNEFDRAKGALDGRGNLGGDIMIHGGSASIGCLAMGDPAIEELFVLVALTGPERTRVIIAPTESVSPDTAAERAPNWLPELYQSLQSELAKLSE
jgi:murein L,D-transpeptidase YafK